MNQGASVISPRHHRGRREALSALVGEPILLMGNGERQRNAAYELPFRQDSTFLWATGCDLPWAAALIDDGRCSLFLPAPSPDSALWEGRVESLETLRERMGVDAVLPRSELEAHCARLRPRMCLAVADAEATAEASRLTGLKLAWCRSPGPATLVAAVGALRNRKGPEEIVELERAAAATELTFRACMAATAPGQTEASLGALFEGVLAMQGCHTSFPTISTIHGEVLHNRLRVNPLEAGRLFLMDGGAEVPSGYAADVTRTWPVSGCFDPRQRAVYQAVLAAEEAAIARCAPGVRFRDVHFTAAREIARFLVEEGLVTCSADAALEAGAHALFFPHGVGHLLGLDVHDLEDLGDAVSYAPGRSRSADFGTRFLRLDLDLAPGHYVTVEPGFYIVRPILEHPELRERFDGLVDFERAASWYGFGGVRIEDDVLITPDGHRVLTAGIPKTVTEIEALVGSGPPASERLV
jgi:Xaa-Pro aminopeptidase